MSRASGASPSRRSRSAQAVPCSVYRCRSNAWCFIARYDQWCVRRQGGLPLGPTPLFSSCVSLREFLFLTNSRRHFESTHASSPIRTHLVAPSPLTIFPRLAVSRTTVASEVALCHIPPHEFAHTSRGPELAGEGASVRCNGR